MATADQVLELIRNGYDYETVGQRLGIPAGLAYLLANGRPADGSSPPTADELRSRPALLASSQHLVNARHHNPLVDEAVNEWVRVRAARELGTP